MTARSSDTATGPMQFAREALEVLAPHMVPRSFRKGQLLWSEGDRDGMLVHLKSGRVKIYRLLPSGKAITLYVFKAGTLFGFMPLLDDIPYPAYAQALEDSEVDVMHRSTLTSAVQKHPEIAIYLLKHLARRLREAFDTIERLSSKGTLPKVASALAALLPDGIDPQAPLFLSLPIPSREFAASLGLSPETFSRTLSVLTERGILKRLKRNKFQVLDLPVLLSAAESASF